jgi:KaiC/GvpD/RAD55 family RecA-like ATPase
VRIKTLAKEHAARCVVIDPVSTWTKSGDGLSAHSVSERLIDWSKAEGITLLCTSLLDELSHREEGGTSLQISTLADTWIHLDYLVQAGERNRGLSIIKSRGTAHSNQVRELVLSNEGVTLADIYTAGGEGSRSRCQAQSRPPRCRGGRARSSNQVAANGARCQTGREGVTYPHHGKSRTRIDSRR